MYYVAANKQFANNKQFKQFCNNQKCFGFGANCELVGIALSLIRKR